MTNGFTDKLGERVFGGIARQYAKHRLSYPEELFTFLAGLCGARDCVWDCATGNGQAAVSLARHFKFVEATDANPEQLLHSVAAPNIRYQIARAESSPFPARHFDMIAVAMAAHWFNLEEFYREASRTLKSGGILALWGYSSFDFTFPEPIEGALREHLVEPLEPLWAPEVRILIDNYRALHFPFTALEAPKFHLSAPFTADDWLGLVSSWSAVRVHEERFGSGIVDSVRSVLEPLWTEPVTVTLPLHLRIARF